MPLGGGQEIGNSCYFLGLGENRLLLDCGYLKSRALPNPARFVQAAQKMLGTIGLELRDIERLYISHAHLDHMGALAYFLAQNSALQLFMTDITSLLTWQQLQNRGFAQNIALRSFIERNLTKVSYLQSIPQRDYEVSFYQAGHIPGAMMTLFNYGGRNILYTGDYSIAANCLTGRGMLPNKPIDTLIICAPHAHHEDACSDSDALMKKLNAIERRIAAQKSLFCQVRQLTKGIELLKYLNEYGTYSLPIYVDDDIFYTAKQLERLGLRLFRDNNYLLSNGDFARQCLVIGKKNTLPQRLGRLQPFRVDFTLHDDFAQTVAFVKKINPRLAIIVHSPNALGPLGARDIEQELLFDGECRTQVLFAETGHAYRF